MAKKHWKEAAAKREAGAFIPLPVVVLRSRSFSLLSAHAIKLLMDLLAQFKGNNNGDLCAAWTLMKTRGWRSKDTLAKALHELIQGDWLDLTRQGGKNRASLYAVSFFAIDECGGKLDVKSTRTASGAWKKNEPLPALPKLKTVPRLSGQLSDDCPAERTNS